MKHEPGAKDTTEMNTIRYTVFIPSYNYGRYLNDAIISVLRQSVDTWELLLIDDASTDTTSEVLKMYEGHPQIKLFRTDNIGTAAMCNLALQNLRGEYIVRLDGDDIFDEHFLLVLGHAMDSDHDLALVFPDYYLVNPFGEIHSHMQRKKLHVNDIDIDIPPNSACTMIRTAVLKEVGGYNQESNGNEDFDLLKKIVENFKTSNIGLPLFYYRQHDDNTSTQSQRIFNTSIPVTQPEIKSRVKGHRPITVVIPCRRNFDFIVDLWNEKIGGKTLLERQIETCLSSDLFDQIIVASDNLLTENIIRQYQDPRLGFDKREPQSTIRTTSIVQTLEAISKTYDPEFKGITVVRYLQSPFVSVDSIEAAILALIVNNADSAIAVEEIPSQVFRRTRYGVEPVNYNGDFRSEFDSVYRDMVSCIVTHNRNFLSGSLTGNTSVSYVLPPSECMNIDSDQKLQIARIMAGDTL